MMVKGMSVAIPVEKRKTAAKTERGAGGNNSFRGAPERRTTAERKPVISAKGNFRAGNSVEQTSSAAVIEKTTSMGGERKISLAQMLVFELRVRDAMTSPPITATPTDTLRSIQHLMKTHRMSGVPILADDVLVGIVSIEDIISALDGGYTNDSVEQWMSRKIVTLFEHFSLVRAVAEFDRHGYGRFPVLDANNRLVGIITRGDITSCLMHHLERRAEEVAAKEAALVAARAADEKAQRVVFHADVKSGDFETAGRISQRMREVLRARGIAPDVLRRAAIIAYEAETNIIIHSLGGRISVAIDSMKVRVKAADNGPGIENIDLAMQEGWSTAGPLARELGFGAGMGLPNIRRCADEFVIQSQLGRGTRLQAAVFLHKAETKL
jgi:CBS domain-containing protein/anti-sigma regulatory factor (Ser/Thr protein kinase)